MGCSLDSSRGCTSVAVATATSGDRSRRTSLDAQLDLDQDVPGLLWQQLAKIVVPLRPVPPTKIGARLVTARIADRAWPQLRSARASARVRAARTRGTG